MSQANIRSLWLVTREYAGIAEAGGVKNVACSLAEGLARAGVAVTAFLPRYGCVATEGTRLFTVSVAAAGEIHTVGFSLYRRDGVDIVFVDSPIYLEKYAVYVYTDEEASHIPGAVRGKGHFDVDMMNVLFQRSVLEYALRQGMVPDIIHCQDAHTASLPAIARTDPRFAEAFRRSGFVVTIHNAGPGYRQTIQGLDQAMRITGLSREAIAPAMFDGRFEPFLLASAYARLSTVSPWYARELTSDEGNANSDGLAGEFRRRGVEIDGITNGIDYARYDPRDPSVSLLPFKFDPASGDLSGKYRCRSDFLEGLQSLSPESGVVCFGSIDPDPHAVYFSYHGRVAWQKGIDVLERAAKEVLDTLPFARFLILGQGDPVLETLLIRMASRYSGRFVYLRGYERSLARMAVAVSDFIVLPSAFEPCGLEDFIAQIFGTIPVAHAVGGLRKIRDGENGYLYYSEAGDVDSAVLSRLLVKLGDAVVEGGGIGCAAVPGYAGLIEAAAREVRERYSWERIIDERYMPLYENVLSCLDTFSSFV